MSSRVADKTYGTVAADRQKEMSGLEFVKGLVDGTLPLNTIARTLGYDIAEVESGRVVISRGRRIGTAEGRITDGNGRLLAHGTTTCLIFER